MHKSTRYPVRSILVKNLLDFQYQAIGSLSLRGRGFGRSHLRDAYLNKHKYTRVIYIRSSTQLLGWALLVQCLDQDALREYSINMYVRKSMRRSGIGKRLWEEVDDFLKDTGSRGHVCIWSKPSEGFYRSVQSDRIAVKVSPRYLS